MGKKGDLNDFERGMVVGARRAGVNISKTENTQGRSHPPPMPCHLGAS